MSAMRIKQEALVLGLPLPLIFYKSAHFLRRRTITWHLFWPPAWLFRESSLRHQSLETLSITLLVLLCSLTGIAIWRCCDGEWAKEERCIPRSCGGGKINKRQINKRKTKGSLITSIPPVYMGDTQENGVTPSMVQVTTLDNISSQRQKDVGHEGEGQ